MNPKKIKTDPVKTVLVITVGFLAIYFLTDWFGALVVALVVGLAGILSGYLAKKIDFIWMKLTIVLSYIVPNIILSVVFYIFLTPLALMQRVFGEKNQLHLKNNNNSLFQKSDKEFNGKSFEKPW